MWHHEKFAARFIHPWIHFIHWTPVPAENVASNTMQAVGPRPFEIWYLKLLLKTTADEKRKLVQWPKHAVGAC